MATAKQMAKFVAGVPEDAAVVVVVQRGGKFVFLSTDDMSNPADVGHEYPNWPETVWEGMHDAMSGIESPENDDGPLSEGSPMAGSA